MIILFCDVEIRYFIFFLSRKILFFTFLPFSAIEIIFLHFQTIKIVYLWVFFEKIAGEIKWLSSLIIKRF